MISRRAALAAAIATPAALHFDRAQAETAPPTLDEFVKPPLLHDAAISPDGKQVAVLRTQGEGRDRLAYVNLLQAADLTAPPRRVLFGDLDVEWVKWANDERLLVCASFARDVQISGGGIDTVNFKSRVRRLVSASLDGKSAIPLFASNKLITQVNYDLSGIIDILPDDPRHILMQVIDPRTGNWSLLKVDIYEDTSERLEFGSDSTVTWMTDRGAPVLRLDADSWSTLKLYARPAGDKSWKFVRKIRRNDLAKLDFDVVGNTDRPGVMLVRARSDADQTTVLRTFDLTTLAFGDVVASRADRDADGVLLGFDGRLAATRYIEDRVAYDFVERQASAHFKAINGFFDNECNLTLMEISRDGQRWLMRVTGPKTRGSYYLYDRAARRMDDLGEVAPWLTPDRLAGVETLRVKARDGAALTAYLTRPLQDGPRPLIVMPHGGPEARDHYDFDAFAQIFAARGWAVLQPNFRGSDGYGRAFADAGRRHWGDRMQEDIDDCVAAALGRGGLDANRRAIWGASYGGYAALMAAWRTPEYRCAVSFAGVSDLQEVLADERRNNGADSPAYDYWVNQIGDPKTDAAALAEASPRRHADGVKMPVLLIHGLDDRIVMPSQSKLMADALKKAGKPYEHVELKDVAHRNLDADDVRAIFERSIAFIDKAFA